ncbi:MAG TPA: S-layer homology domain-containing protein [Bacillus sp. (in: firmicutes)]|nr:S-layer homology domain-containing protein [Bacillus sp. (in: firmicutes)]
MLQKFCKGLMVIVLIFSLFTINAPWGLASAASMPLSSGVFYENQLITNEDGKQSINILEVDLSDPYTELELSVPDQLGDRYTTTNHANRNSFEGHRAVGAINGSFFDMSSGLPMYLIAKNNQIINSGIIAIGDHNYVNEPTAFGVTADGKALIDHFNMNLRIAWDGANYSATGVNKVRNENELVIYTPDHGGGYTNTNQYGKEFVVITDEDLTDGVHFGDVFSGTIQSIRGYGDTRNTAIPDNGFVVSFNGEMWMNRTASLKIGDRIEFTADINDPWKNAEYILGSGPLLVKDGQVHITMDENSSRARTNEPRSALAIDASGEKVYLVTVDGRQSGFSEGMSMRDLAEYLVSLGVNRAINLDGGGSTTLGIRKYGNTQVTLANSPSGGSERAVSTALVAVSTAPLGQPAYISAKKSREGKLLVGSSVSISTDYVLDQYYNPLNYQTSDFQFSVSNGIASVDANGKVTATKAGQGAITVKIGSATKTLPLDVIDSINSFKIVGGVPKMAIGQNVIFKTEAYDSNKQPIIYDPNLIKWSVEGEIGSIAQNGSFTATKPGKGAIVASYNGSSVKYAVEVTAGPVILHSMNQTNGWRVQSARGEEVSMSLSTSPSPVREGSGSIKLQYDFTKGEAGTKAAYLVASPSIQITGLPKKIGAWVFANGDNHWLRGTVKDSQGNSYTINFTEEGGLNWTGWRYVEAQVPQTISSPIFFDRIYVAEPTANKQNKGVIYIDKIQAIFTDNHVEPLFNDIPNDYFAKTEISYLVDRSIINGYPDGYFRPGQTLTRAHAAALIARALNLDLTNPGGQVFTDVPVSHPYYREIAAVQKAGYMNGKGDGTFDPQGYLTRAQMAVVLTNAFKLTGTTSHQFTDVGPEFWAYDVIQTLYASGVTTGYKVDNTYRPNEFVNRTQYSVFIYRVLNR